MRHPTESQRACWEVGQLDARARPADNRYVLFCTLGCAGLTRGRVVPMSQDEVEPDKAVDDSTTRWGVFFLQLLGCVVVALA